MDSLKISIDWNNETNKSHVYKDIFSSKDSDYISWLYITGKKVEVLDPLSDSKVRKSKKRGGNAPLIFTVEKDGVVTYEKVRNAVHPTKRKRSKAILSRLNIDIPTIEGSLPKGTITYTSDDGKKRRFGIEFHDTIRHVKIEILNLDEELIYVIEDQKLEPGEYKYKWDGTDYPSGDYILRHTMDGQIMSQTIDIGSSGLGWLGTLWNRIF